MNNRYMVISPDTLEAMRRAGHAAKLEVRIEKLEAELHSCFHRIEELQEALAKVAEGYETEWSTSSVTNMLDIAQILSERIVIARKALGGKDD